MSDTETETEAWQRVKEYTERAVWMYYDGCHKIYLAMDDAQLLEYDGYTEDHRPDSDKLDEWYDQSCGLRFVTATTSHPDGDIFESLIPQQFAGEED